MLVINRFQVSENDDPAFQEAAGVALDTLRGQEGIVSAELVRNLDEPSLWALVCSWRDVGSYRRALQGAACKAAVVPLLQAAVDEPSAYDTPRDVGPNLPRMV